MALTIDAIFDLDVKQLDHGLKIRKINCSASALKTEKQTFLLRALIAESAQTQAPTVPSPSMYFKSRVELQFQVAEQNRLAEGRQKQRYTWKRKKN